MSDKNEAKENMTKQPAIEKQVANLAYTVRKIKDWLETRLGADIDGDGRIGSGPVKKALVFLCVCGMAMAVTAAPANTNIALWWGNANNPTTYIDAVGGVHASGFHGNSAGVTNLPISFTRQTTTLNYAATNAPTVTVTEQTGAVTAEGANNLVTPTATPTLQTGAVTAEGANNLVTPTITVTIQTTTGFDATGAAITNAAGESVLMMTNATATASPDLASNAVVVVTVTGGSAVMTNLTIAVTPDLASNAVAAVTVTGGGAVLTNVDVSATVTAASLVVVTNGTCSNP